MKHQHFFSCLLLFLMSITAHAYDIDLNGIYYNITSSNTVEVTYVENGDGNADFYYDDVAIPRRISKDGTTYTVTAIGIYAFSECSSLTSVTIPNSVTSIGYGAFSECSSLTSVTIPNSVTSIGRGAFGGCFNLARIMVESGNPVYDSRGNCNAIIETASNSLVSGCKNTVIPNSVTIIGRSAFEGCTDLTSVNIPNSVTTIGGWAFFGCNGLTSVTIPNSVTSIGYSAFCGCSGLTSVVIPNSFTSIGDYAFADCSGLTSVTIPNSVTAIGNGAFERCSSLTSVTIPNSVTNIGNSAFYGCSSFTSVTIPSSVTSIGDYAFRYCSALASIEVEEGNPVYDSRANCNAIIETASNSLVSGCKNTVIPNSVTIIGRSAFEGCTDLTSVNIPNSVTSIGSYAFHGCSGLKDLRLPRSLSSIGYVTFMDCSNLQRVVSEIENPFDITITSRTFENISNNAVLYVPTGKKASYLAHQGWDVFSEIIETDEYFNYLEVANTKIAKGGAGRLDISMNNISSITAFEFEVKLPQGVTLTKCELTDRKKSGHNISSALKSNGNYQVTCISLSSEAFSGNEGTLVNLILTADKNLAIGDYEVSIKNIELTTTDAQALTPEDVSATLTVTNVKLGDTNGDGRVTISDAVAIVNYKLDNPPSNFVNEAADVNLDNRVSITDAVAIVNMILAGENEANIRSTMEPGRMANTLEPE